MSTSTTEATATKTSPTVDSVGQTPATADAREGNTDDQMPDSPGHWEREAKAAFRSRDQLRERVRELEGKLSGLDALTTERDSLASELAQTRESETAVRSELETFKATVRDDERMRKLREIVTKQCGDGMIKGVLRSLEDEGTITAETSADEVVAKTWDYLNRNAPGLLHVPPTGGTPSPRPRFERSSGRGI